VLFAMEIYLAGKKPICCFQVIKYRYAGLGGYDQLITQPFGGVYFTAVADIVDHVTIFSRVDGNMAEMAVGPLPNKFIVVMFFTSYCRQAANYDQ